MTRDDSDLTVMRIVEHDQLKLPAHNKRFSKAIAV